MTVGRTSSSRTTVGAPAATSPAAGAQCCPTCGRTLPEDDDLRIDEGGAS